MGLRRGRVGLQDDLRGCAPADPESIRLRERLIVQKVKDCGAVSSRPHGSRRGVEDRPDLGRVKDERATLAVHDERRNVDLKSNRCLMRRERQDRIVASEDANRGGRGYESGGAPNSVRPPVGVVRAPAS